MGEFIYANFLIKVNPANYLKIKNKIPSNVNILAVSKGFKSQEIKTIHNLGQDHFGESKFQEAFEKQLILKDLKQINWHFIGRIQTNKIRKIVQNFKYIHSVDSFEKLQKISNISLEEKKNPLIMLQVKLSDDHTKGGFNPEFLILVERLFQNIFLRTDQGADSLLSKKKIIIKPNRFRTHFPSKSLNVIVNTLSICFICIAIFLRKLYGAL